jgi:uncharacterized protein (TIGR02001 family)
MTTRPRAALRIILCRCALAAAGTIVPTVSASADGSGFLSGTFEATIGGTTDYVDRGVSQTGGKPAIQGSFDYSLDSGPYAEVFISSADFNDVQVELDYTLGWEQKIDKIKLDAGVTLTTYPGSAPSLAYDYWETNLALSRDFGPVKLTGRLAFSPNYFGGSGKEFYAEVGPDFRLPLGFTISARVGQQWVEAPSKAGLPDYLNWQIGISRETLGFTGSLLYTGTDAAGQCGMGRECGQGVLFELTRKF